MAQSLELNIKTTSDVPQAMEKAKTATVSFSKQVDDIQKKFSTAFKDIFLGFTAPMVLLQGAISMISNAVAKAKQDAKEGLDLVAKGETAFASSEEKRMAAFFKAKKEREEEARLVREGVVASFVEFSKTEDGRAFIKANADRLRNTPGKAGAASVLETNPALAMKNNPELYALALDAFKRSPEGIEAMKAPESAEEKKAGTFKGPEGFGTVVGVGANPVLEKMTRQNEVLEEIKLILQEQSLINRGGMVPSPFTERVPLTLQKIGAV